MDVSYKKNLKFAPEETISIENGEAIFEADHGFVLEKDGVRYAADIKKMDKPLVLQNIETVIIRAKGDTTEIAFIDYTECSEESDAIVCTGGKKKPQYTSGPFGKGD